MTILEEVQNSTVVRAYRKSWLAWLGANKAAFDFAQDGVGKAKETREQFIKELVGKGESIEGQAVEGLKNAMEYGETSLTTLRDKVTSSSKFFADSTDGNATNTADDRFEKLSEEISKLSKNVSALTRKVNTVRKAAGAVLPVKKASLKSAPKTDEKSIGKVAA